MMITTDYYAEAVGNAKFERKGCRSVVIFWPEKEKIAKLMLYMQIVIFKKSWQTKIKKKKIKKSNL